MTENFLKRGFFLSDDPLISKFLQKWPKGSLVAAAKDYEIRTAVADQTNLILGVVTTIHTNDVKGVPTYVIHRVQRENGAAAVGERQGVGTFLAFQAALATLDLANEVDKMSIFNLAIQAPVGHRWQRFCALMGMHEAIVVPMVSRGGDIVMPGRRYGKTT